MGYLIEEAEQLEHAVQMKLSEIRFCRCTKLAIYNVRTFSKVANFYLKKEIDNKLNFLGFS